MSLSNTDGGLRGVRYLPRVAQPWGDVAAPAVSTRVVTAVVKAGATTIRTIQGHNESETVGNNISMDQYTSFYGASVEGEYLYVQAGGTNATDTTTRVRFAPSTIIRSRLLGAYDWQQSATASASVSYAAYGRGNMLRYTPNTGERGDIALTPEWYVRALLNQSVLGERCVRVNGLVAGGWRIVVRQQASKNVIACVDIKPTYTGMGTMRTGWRHWPAAYMTGLQNPAGGWKSMWAEEFCSHHRASAFYYPAILTGEQNSSSRPTPAWEPCAPAGVTGLRPT